MTPPRTTPFSKLAPELVLDAVDALGFRTDGRLLPLNSFENRVFQIGIEEGAPLVAKFYRPGRWSNEAIEEEHAFVAELAAAEVPVVPALVASDGQALHHFGGYRFALYPKQGGRAPELDRAGTLEQMGRALARLHNVGVAAPFAARPRLELATFGEEPRDFLLQHGFLPPDLEPAYRSVAELALQGAAAAFARAGALTELRLHGDCHLGNVLWSDTRSGAGPFFVDFDDARRGPAAQDLWMLLSGARAEMSEQLGELLRGYELFREFDRRELLVIEALRTLRLMHYAAWLARRWEDPAFPAAFPWFNTQRYWQDHILQLREQVAAMEEEPLIATRP